MFVFSKVKCSKDDNRVKAFGTRPDSWVSSKLKWRSRVIAPISDGIVPCSEFRCSLSRSRVESCPTVLGMNRLILFCERSRNTREVIEPTWFGMLPALIKLETKWY